MFAHIASYADLQFRREFEAGEVPPGAFNHLAHLRLAYVYRVEGNLAYAEQRMRQSLLAFLAANNIPEAKYHETLTWAWVMAVSHFMNRSSSSSFDEFAANSQPLLDSKVMFTHYSHDSLFSEVARAAFVEPNLEAIPH